MMKSNGKVFSLLAVMFATLLVNVFICPFFGNDNFAGACVWTVFFLLFYFICNQTGEKSKHNIDTIQLVSLYSVGFFLVKYILGLCVGFTASNHISFLSVFPILTIIVLQELLRNYVLKNSNKDKLVMFSLITVFVMFDTLLNASFYNIKSSNDIIVFAGLFIIPSIVKNIVLSHISNNSNAIPNIIYRVVMEVCMLILPVVPDFKIYIEGPINIVFVILLYYKLSLLFIHSEEKVKSIKKMISMSINVVLTAVFVALIILVSNLFKYTALAVASNSMIPTFKRGDSVLIRKLENNEKSELKVGDMIAVRHDGKIVVHRINIKDSDASGYYYITKGDANNTNDAYHVYESDIIGKIENHFAYIGYPSLWITELFDKKE